MANLYHRKLFTEFDSAEINQELNDAVMYLEDERTPINRTLKGALIDRLVFRRHLLSAVRIEDIMDPRRASIWEQCIEALPELKSTAQHGKPVEGSFSIKIQRKLASTVPPRPMVMLGFDDAHNHLTRLCQYGKEAYRILDYRGGPHMLVSYL